MHFGLGFVFGVFLTKSGSRSAFFGSRRALFFQKFEKKKKIFENRFEKVITFRKTHAGNFSESSLIVKTPYVFWSWICL